MDFKEELGLEEVRGGLVAGQLYSQAVCHCQYRRGQVPTHDACFSAKRRVIMFSKQTDPRDKCCF